MMRLGTVAAALLLAAGCSGTWRGEVLVVLDPALRDAAGRWPTLEVDLVGGAAADAARWQAVPVEAYFEPGSQARSGAPRVTLWFDGDHPAGTLSEQDPIWELWTRQGADTLVVFANLLAGERGSQAPGAPGPADGRRLLVPLAKDRVPLDRDGRLVLRAVPSAILPLPAVPADGAQAPGAPAQTRNAGDQAPAGGDQPAPRPSPIRRATSDAPQELTR